MGIIEKIFGGKKKRDSINRNAQKQLDAIFDEERNANEERKQRDKEREKNRKNNSGYGSYHK